MLWEDKHFSDSFSALSLALKTVLAHKGIHLLTKHINERHILSSCWCVVSGIYHCSPRLQIQQVWHHPVPSVLRVTLLCSLGLPLSFRFKISFHLNYYIRLLISLIQSSPMWEECWLGFKAHLFPYNFSLIQDMKFLFQSGLPPHCPEKMMYFLPPSSALLIPHPWNALFLLASVLIPFI